jgi:ArsR family transcriptional regulator, arsenate/arsenite/antimonite-responsive transcriptional repressor / arsenate reductase (thioredoxin)
VVALSVSESVAPSFLRLAGHPVRWRLLRELADGDRRARELTERVGGRQSLVSYHLGQLRAGGLVAARRSSADGRDVYYRLEVSACGRLLAQAGGALHPALAFASPPSVAVRAARVLFLCTGNSARSQMAQALLERRGAGAVKVASAGSHPKALHPNAVRAMRARGIDIGERRPRHIDELSGQRFDFVISLCDRVREVCPEFPGHPAVVHWSMPDPSRAAETDEDSYPAFDRTADELDERIGLLLHRIDSDAQVLIDETPGNPIDPFEPASVS